LSNFPKFDGSANSFEVATSSVYVENVLVCTSCTIFSSSGLVEKLKLETEE
jgi:hypothetical protein